MPTPFSLQHDGHRIEVTTERPWQGDRVRLLVDGAAVAEAKAGGRDTVLAGGGVEVRVDMPWHGGAIRRAVLLRRGGEPLPLEPAPGSAAARRARLERERPGLYAARHVAKGIAQGAATLIGLTFLISLLPAIPLPSIDLPALPRPDLPDLPLPSVDLPDVPTPPAWVRTIMAAKEIWLPVLVGIALAVREWRRRRPGPDAPSGTGEAARRTGGSARGRTGASRTQGDRLPSLVPGSGVGDHEPTMTGGTPTPTATKERTHA